MQNQTSILFTTLIKRLFIVIFFFGIIALLSHLNSITSPPNSNKPVDPNENRLQTAINEKKEIFIKKINRLGINWDELDIFIRAFKAERKLEVWGKNNKDRNFKLLKIYNFCETSGVLGPKRKSGDRQIPEGIYHINRFNEKSKFYLSLGLNYPNKSDKVLGHQQDPGRDIFIHGECLTIGCIPITNDKIKEVFLLTNQARVNGQTNIPVHIFPAILSDKKLKSIVKSFPQHTQLWNELKAFYNHFEQTKQIPDFQITKNGTYKIIP